jgi:hypothetical protein
LSVQFPPVLREMESTSTSGYGASCIFYSDGSLIEGCAGFAVNQMGVGGFGHKILSPAGGFTAELSALFNALRHIAEVIRPPERCIFLTEFDQGYVVQINCTSD